MSQPSKEELSDVFEAVKAVHEREGLEAWIYCNAQGRVCVRYVRIGFDKDLAPPSPNGQNHETT